MMVYPVFVKCNYIYIEISSYGTVPSIDGHHLPYFSDCNMDWSVRHLDIQEEVLGKNLL
jgi:hypothetical protein